MLTRDLCAKSKSWQESTYCSFGIVWVLLMAILFGLLYIVT
jgi:hypothetical protein